MTVNYKDLSITFLISGTVFTMVKYTVTELNNPALAAVFAGIPIGLISIYLIEKDKCAEYTHNYFFVTLILLSSILLFYIIFINTLINKNLILIISLLFWMSLVSLRYYYTKIYKNNSK